MEITLTLDVWAEVDRDAGAWRRTVDARFAPTQGDYIEFIPGQLVQVRSCILNSSLNDLQVMLASVEISEAITVDALRKEGWSNKCVPKS